WLLSLGRPFWPASPLRASLCGGFPPAPVFSLFLARRGHMLLPRAHPTRKRPAVSFTASPPTPPQTSAPTTSVRHFVLAALLVITAINYVQRNAINPAMTTIEEDLALRLAEVGLIAGAFFLSYTIMQVPSGLLAQFIGAKRSLVLFAAGWSLA